VRRLLRGRSAPILSQQLAVSGAASSTGSVVSYHWHLQLLAGCRLPGSVSMCASVVLCAAWVSMDAYACRPATARRLLVGPAIHRHVAGRRVCLQTWAVSECKFDAQAVHASCTSAPVPWARSANEYRRLACRDFQGP
jgi:hypothetical protein